MFVAVDVIGTIPFFIGMSEGLQHRVRSKVIRQSVLTALVVTVAFIFVGQALFNFLTVKIYDFMFAGGAVLFIISLRDLLSRDTAQVAPDPSFGVVPLGTPLMAGPAVLATAMVVSKPYGVGATLVSVVLNMLIAGLAFHYSKFIIRIFGRDGARAFSKIMALVLSAYGVMMMRRGLIEIIDLVR